jgi:hypothetical protein
VLGHILRAHTNGSTRKFRLDLSQIGRRSSHGHTRLVASRQALLDGLQQSGIGSQAAVHLPVANNEFLLHVSQVKTILPVCWLDSISA